MRLNKEIKQLCNTIEITGDIAILNIKGIIMELEKVTPKFYTISANNNKLIYSADKQIDLIHCIDKILNH